MVTEKEVKRQVREAFRNYDLIGELFPEINGFYTDYRALHAQLKEGDILEIRVQTHCDPEDGGRWNRMPGLHVYLVSSEGEEKEVIAYGTWEGERFGERLLND